jgi:hypothetical protein
MAGRAQISGPELQRLLRSRTRRRQGRAQAHPLGERPSRHRAALGVDPLEGQIRQVFFFDTPELALNAAGVVVRARRRQGEEADTVVKLRPSCLPSS